MSKKFRAATLVSSRVRPHAAVGRSAAPEPGACFAPLDARIGNSAARVQALLARSILLSDARPGYSTGFARTCAGLKHASLSRWLSSVVASDLSESGAGIDPVGCELTDRYYRRRMVDGASRTSGGRSP